MNAKDQGPIRKGVGREDLKNRCRDESEKWKKWRQESALFLSFLSPSLPPSFPVKQEFLQDY